jgi:hypothetical protein
VLYNEAVFNKEQTMLVFDSTSTQRIHNAEQALIAAYAREQLDNELAELAEDDYNTEDEELLA